MISRGIQNGGARSIKIKRFLAMTLPLFGAFAAAKAVENFAQLETGYGQACRIFEVDGCRAFILLPHNAPVDGSAGAWVWYAPAIMGNPHQCVDWLFRQLLAHQIVIAGIDVGETYANPTARLQFWNFYEAVRVRFHLAAKACLLAQSRGGLNHYLFAAEHPETVRCIAGIYPVMDLRSYPGIPRAAAAYGLGEKEFGVTLPHNNPIDNLAPIARARVPIFHIQGDSDKVVPLAQNSAVAYDRYRALGGPMTLLTVKGKGHDEVPEIFQAQELLDFLLRHAAAQ